MGLIRTYPKDQSKRPITFISQSYKLLNIGYLFTGITLNRLIKDLDSHEQATTTNDSPLHFKGSISPKRTIELVNETEKSRNEAESSVKDIAIKAIENSGKMQIIGNSKETTAKE